MKVFLVKFSALLLLFFQPLVSSEKAVRGAYPWGFFADFLWTLNHLEFCSATGKTPVIYWGNESAYFSPQGYNGSTNVWEYYFEPVSNASYSHRDHVYKDFCYKRANNFATQWGYCQYIQRKDMLPLDEQKSLKAVEDHAELYADPNFIYSKEAPMGEYHLYDPIFRTIVKKQILDRFIKIKPSIKNKIDSFYKEHMAGKKTIGIHLRGKHIWNEVLFVPLKYIFEEANQYSKLGYQFFIATDQSTLIREAQSQLLGPVIYYEAERFEETTSPDGTCKLTPQLGEDLLIETLLLSQTDHLIHTLSNVSTAVLYFNPELSHTLLY